MISINDRPCIRRVFDGLHLERTELAYTVANGRSERPAPTGELILSNWEPAALGRLL